MLMYLARVSFLASLTAQIYQTLPPSIQQGKAVRLRWLRARAQERVDVRHFLIRQDRVRVRWHLTRRRAELMSEGGEADRIGREFRSTSTALAFGVVAFKAAVSHKHPFAIFGVAGRRAFCRRARRERTKKSVKVGEVSVGDHFGRVRRHRFHGFAYLADKHCQRNSRRSDSRRRNLARASLPIGPMTLAAI